MPVETEWLVGRQQIADHLGISPETLDEWRGMYPGIPIVVIHGRPRAKISKLNEWIMENAENRCPVDKKICPRRQCGIS